jgi:hypothetical protein
VDRAVRGSYFVRTAANGRWGVLFWLKDGTKVLGSDRFLTEWEARCFAACDPKVIRVAGVPRNVRRYDLVDGRNPSKATAAPVAQDIRVATVLGRAPAAADWTDPWFNQVAIDLADLGLTEVARNTGQHVVGLPIQGDITLDTARFSASITLFANADLARQAELALRAKPALREGMSKGVATVRTIDRVVYVADARGGVLDEFLLEDVILAVGKISLPTPVDNVPGVVEEPEPPVTTRTASRSDTLEQLRKTR